MNDRQRLSDETLMAYADGELDAGTAQAVAEALEKDPEMAERVALFSRTGALLAAAGRARPDSALPPEFQSQIDKIIAKDRTASADEAEAVMDLPSVAARRRLPASVGYAMAASIALAVGLAGGYLLPRGYEQTGESAIAALESPALHAALSALPSGERSALAQGEIEMIASFTNAESEFCREFQYTSTDQAALISIACLRENQWQTRFAVASHSADSTSYVPASSLAALDAYLASVGAGAPMDRDQELAALEGLD